MQKIKDHNYVDFQGHVCFYTQKEKIVCCNSVPKNTSDQIGSGICFGRVYSSSDI